MIARLIAIMRFTIMNSFIRLEKQRNVLGFFFLWMPEPRTVQLCCCVAADRLGKHAPHTQIRRTKLVILDSWL